MCVSVVIGGGGGVEGVEGEGGRGNHVSCRSVTVSGSHGPGSRVFTVWSAVVGAGPGRRNTIIV